MSYSIYGHLDYNEWANSRIVSMLEPVSEDLIFREIKSSFPSIAKTMLHINDAEKLWMMRMKGVSLRTFPSAEFKGGKTPLLEMFCSASEELIKFINEKDPSFLNTSYNYKTIKGEPFTNTVEDTLFHVVNHGTYHRGQIITMLRELGVTTLLSTDLIHYIRSQGK